MRASPQFDAEFSPEVQLLLCCARTRLDDSHHLQLNSLLAEDLDWPQLIGLADRHAVLPLLHHHLHDAKSIPAEIKQRLRSVHEVNAFSNAMLTSELCTLLDLFRRHDLTTIAFKGPALSLVLYDSLLLRAFGDLDLFIRKSDLGRMTQLLQASGYQLSLSKREQRYFLKHRYHFHFVRNDGKAVVEVHWAFTPRCWPYPLGDDVLFDRSTNVAFHKTLIPCLNREHTLLVLCAHGGKERWARLQLVIDVSELIRGSEIDWPWVLAESQRMKRERVLLLGIGLARSLLGVNLPVIIDERIKMDEAVSVSIHQLRQRFFSDRNWPLQGMELHRYFLRVWPHPSDRIRYLQDFLRHLPSKLRELASPSPEDQIVVLLPRQFKFLNYISRGLRLTMKYRNPCRLVQRISKFLLSN